MVLLTFRRVVRTNRWLFLRALARNSGSGRDSTRSTRACTLLDNRPYQLLAGGCSTKPFVFQPNDAKCIIGTLTDQPRTKDSPGLAFRSGSSSVDGARTRTIEKLECCDGGGIARTG